MRAVVYKGTRDVSVEEVPDAAIQQPTDAVVKITATNICVPEDPGAADELAKDGKMAFDFGTFFFKGQSMGTGQANVKNCNRYLRDLIHQGRAKPSQLVSHNLGLADAPDAYRHFDNRDAGWTKVVLNPGKG
jgi:threonine dehydrogenase-like Zn-dependent dehydrogenase